MKLLVLSHPIASARCCQNQADLWVPQLGATDETAK
jgi:hypothetical protein